MKTLADLRPLVLAPVLLLCSASPASPPSAKIPLQPITDQLPARYTLPIDVVIKSARDYRLLFGHDAKGVDFAQEWVVLYSAGSVSVLSSASIGEVRMTEGGNAMEVITLLSQDPCSPLFVAQPAYAMVKMPAQDPAPALVRFLHMFATTECLPD